MSLAAFEQSIESESLRGLVRHWAEVRRNRRLPGWDDIRPSAIKAQLPIIWSWKFDPGTREFTGRLAGERIQSVFGTNLRGAKMADVFVGHDYERMLARHTRVATGPEYFHGHGLVFRHLNRFDIGERIILPLADDGEHGDGIVGATDFRSNFHQSHEPPLGDSEVEEWFVLD
jgi:hypothetical protein